MRPDDLFAAACEASQRALAAAGTVSKSFRIGGLPVRIRFAGEAMMETVLPALSHLEQPDCEAADGLTVTVWDCQSTGVEPPFSADLWNQCTPWGELTATRGGPVHASRLMDVGVYSMLDIRSGRAVFWTHRPEQVPVYARAAALRSILHIWMRARGRIFLHGASVALRERSVLLAGRGGSGKSTTALLCALAGWQYLGDDYCLALPGAEPRTASLYNSAKLSPDQWERFSRWTRAPHAIRDAQSGKAVVFLAYDPSVRMIAEARLAAILLPVIGGEKRSALAPVPAAEAWKAAAPSTVLQLPGAGAEDLAAIGGLARRVPCRRLILGRDWEALPELMETVLETESEG